MAAETIFTSVLNGVEMQFAAFSGRRGVGPELLGAARAFLAGG